MLIFFESFDSGKLSSAWVTNTISIDFVSGRLGGKAASLSANGPGVFMAMYALPSSCTDAVFGFALNLKNPANEFSVMFYDGGQEQSCVKLNGEGQIALSVPGQLAIGQTGINNFAGCDWNYFEIYPSFKNKQLTVTINERPIFSTPMKTKSLSFNRVVISVPENQTKTIDLDDLRFDDDMTFRGDTTVLSLMGRSVLPYSPTTIHAVKIEGSEILSMNPTTKLPWTIWQLNSFPSGSGCVEVLASTSQVNLTQVSMVMSD